MVDPRMVEILDARTKLIDKGTSDFERRLLELSDNLGRRVAASLGDDPDKVRPPDGDDGRLVGRSDFERRLQGLSEAEAIRAAVTASSLEEIEDLVDLAGLGDAREGLRRVVAKIAGAAERSLSIQGVVAAEGALDTVAAEALLTGFLDNQIDEALISGISRNSAIRIRQAIVSNLGLETVQEVATRIADAEEMSIGRATTEARTRLQMADRTCQDIVRKTVEQTGAKFLLAYLGPKPDKIIRSFCRHLVMDKGTGKGMAYRVEDFDSANNAMTPEHPRYAGGGYNCRHYVQPVVDDDDVLESLGLKRGTIEDIRAANAAAVASRKKKGRRKK